MPKTKTNIQKTQDNIDAFTSNLTAMIIAYLMIKHQDDNLSELFQQQTQAHSQEIHASLTKSVEELKNVVEQKLLRMSDGSVAAPKGFGNSAGGRNIEGLRVGR